MGKTLKTERGLRDIQTNMPKKIYKRFYFKKEAKFSKARIAEEIIFAIRHSCKYKLINHKSL